MLHHHRSHTARLRLSAGVALAALVAGCTTPQLASFPAPKVGDEGVVIAESKMLLGATTASNVVGNTEDCAGPGLGIIVQGSTGEGKYLYDITGEPCDSAQVLFDGRTKLGQRSADPAITLTFHDSFGPIPDDSLSERSELSESPPRRSPKRSAGEGGQPQKPKPLSALPPIRVVTSLLEDNSGIEPAAGPTTKAKPELKKTTEIPQKPDPLIATLSSWQAQDDTIASRMAEAEAAAARNLENIAAEARQQQETEAIAQLAAKLRERERQIQEEQRRHAESLERANQNREQTTAARQAWQQQENALQAQLATTQERLQQFEQLSSRLQQEKAQKEQAYQQQIETLSADLKAAEQQAESSRRELILKAAAKIAEAEQLAHAAQLQEQDIKLREAARLKSEAETMLDRALALKAGQQVTIAGAPPAANMALGKTPVVIRAKDEPLQALLTTILQQAAPQAGEWQADWQLSAPAQKLLAEKWSLTAEAPVEQVFAQLAAQIQKAHGITLKFTQFTQSRLVVVTDTP
ncbi:MAG: hypothetical protein EBQ80_00495 [Proteobacteria bacterium]|nr:hypothetical protein [Pseudomonadota bacterium]